MQTEVWQDLYRSSSFPTYKKGGPGLELATRLTEADKEVMEMLVQFGNIRSAIWCKGLQ
jgi:hypothetical protein